MSEPAKARRILLGTIVSVHGIRGEVVIKTYTGDPAAIADYGPLSDAAGKRTFKIKGLRATDKGVVARLEGISDRTTAETLRGTDLYVAREKLPKPDEAEYYHADLIGLAARSPAGDTLGEIVAVANFGAGDLLELRLTGQRITEYIPFTNANVPSIDLAAGHAVIVMPELVGDPEPASGEDDDSDGDGGDGGGD
ncbi:MAG: ribosome maturation factor RimM [Hyphomicrobium sp.]